MNRKDDFVEAEVTDSEAERKAKSKRIWSWILLAVAVIYTISPVDLVPDVVPVVGWIDDALMDILAVVNLIRQIRGRKQG